MRFSLGSSLSPPPFSAFLTSQREEMKNRERGRKSFWVPTTCQVCAGSSHTSEAVVERASFVPGTVLALGLYWLG